MTTQIDSACSMLLSHKFLLPPSVVRFSPNARVGRLVLLFALCLVAGCATTTHNIAKAPAPPKNPIAPDRTYPCGLKFPARLEIFDRVGATRARGNVVAANYVRGYGEIKAQTVMLRLFLNVAVLVQPANGNTAAALLEQNRAAFLAAHPDATEDPVHSMHGEGLYFTFDKAREKLGKKGGVELFAAKRGDYLISYQFGFLPMRHDEWRSAIDRFMTALESQ